MEPILTDGPVSADELAKVATRLEKALKDTQEKEQAAVRLTEERDAEIKSSIKKATEETARKLDAQADELDAAKKEVAELQEEIKRLHGVGERIDKLEANRRPSDGGGDNGRKSLGAQFVESEYLATLRRTGERPLNDFEAADAELPHQRKTLLDTSTISPQAVREPMVIPGPSMVSLSIRDLVGGGTPTERTSGQYYEETGFNPGTTQSVSGITRSGSVATATFAAAHAWGSVGQQVFGTFAGANQTEYNGTFLVTIASSTTVTYNVSGTPVTPATGTLVAYLNFAGGAAAPVAEGSALAEARWQATLREWAVREIGHWLPVTERTLEDNAELRALIDDRLVYGIQFAEDVQALYGDGTSENLNGILNNSFIHQYAWSEGLVSPVDTQIDAVRRGLTRMHMSQYMPDGLVYNALDWEQVELMKGTDGHYLAITMIDSAGISRFFRLPVVVSTNLLKGTVLGGNFRQAAAFRDRAGVRVKISDSHEDYFVKSKLAIKATERTALVVYRPQAFVKITLDAAPS